MRKPSHDKTVATSVPKTTPDIVFAMRKMAGKCLTLILTRPLIIVTVCSGTSCLKATSKAAWMDMEPCKDFHLGLEVRHFCVAYDSTVATTHPRLCDKVMTWSKRYRTDAMTFGTSVTTSRNFANSAEPQARSRYFPP